ncbi:CACNA1G [Symbiodinium necroappetens]|uniref:CACNA1G protein n=1 Tax=Symbiodinium necroappetens TaxID=1628268 RepID=A0A813BMS6_9DINO|nr:CACNA1G [Symbiodinium necroappetens]
MASVLNDLGVGNQGITREKFMSMSNDPKLLRDLQELGIKQKQFEQITKLLYDSKEAEGGKDETHRVLTGEEIVSELFRLQPGTALNFSDLATTEKKLLEQRKDIRKRIGRIEELLAIGLGRSGPAQSASCGLVLESIGPSRPMSPVPLTPLSQMSPASPSRPRNAMAPTFGLQEGDSSPDRAANASSATLQRLARIDSRTIIEEIRRRLGLKDLGAVGVCPDWCEDDLAISACKFLGCSHVFRHVNKASLTRHLPPPEVVNAQKEQNYREVDEQLQQAQLLLEEQTKREKEYLRAQATQAKEVLEGRWDQHLRAQEISAEQDFQKSLAQLHESSRMMRLKLEEQASQLVIEYQTRRTQEEINRHKHEVELHHWEPFSLSSSSGFR